MTEETLTVVGVFFYVIGNYSVMFLLHKNAPRGCDQMHEELVRFVLVTGNYEIMRTCLEPMDTEKSFRIPADSPSLCTGSARSLWISIFLQRKMWIP